MLRTSCRRGRPPKFVLDPNGRPIVGLSYHKATGSYYATYSKPRVWFGSDLGKALFNFRRYWNGITITDECASSCRFFYDNLNKKPENEKL